MSFPASTFPPIRRSARRPLGGLAVAVLAIGLAAAPGPAAQGAEPSTGLAARATITTSKTSGNPAHLRDGRPTSRSNDVGAALALSARPGEWVDFRWSSRQPITSIQIYGARTGAVIKAGVLTFDGYSNLPVGEILPDPTRPTMLSFRSRSTTRVRFTITRVEGSGLVNLAELRIFPKGVTPVRYGAADPATLARDPVNPTCTPGASPASSSGAIAVLCPLTNSTVRGTRPVTVHADGLTRVAMTAWSVEPGTAGLAEMSAPVTGGRASAALDFSRLRPGPVVVQVRGIAGPGLATSAPVHFQVFNAGARASALPAAAAGARGKTLAYVEAFDRPISWSYDGRKPTADYAAAKPEPWGVSQFGSAIFPDPARGFDNLRVVEGGHLRLGVQPNPRGYTDPNGWGRQHLGAMLSSARPGGSGFAARYGYYEARIAAPATAGTWPAFWLLPTDHLVEPKPTVAEIDIVELYGHDPRGACHTTHFYQGGQDRDGVALCGRRFGSVSEATRWHTYGVNVDPEEITYWIDGKVVARAPQVKGGEKPLFFMLDLNLGGGWPVKLDPVQNRAAMYVDWVRVYV